MKKEILGIALVGLLSGCSTMTPPRYSVSVDNVEILRQYGDKQGSVADFELAAQFDSNCRLMGPIEPADGLTVPEFIARAFNDEFKMAGIYSASGNQITGVIDRISFSSISGITGGWWDIAITLNSSNGKTLKVENKYEFKSGFDAITACNQTADALTPAVQDLIKSAVSNPSFESLL